MPTYRGITLALQSQFDIAVLPEYAPPELPDGAEDREDVALGWPKLKEEDDSRVNVYIPAIPRSQFWVQYDCTPLPGPPGAKPTIAADPKNDVPATANEAEQEFCTVKEGLSASSSVKLPGFTDISVTEVLKHPQSKPLPPLPKESKGHEAKQPPFYVFKLFIDGTHIITWSCGEKEEWQGKTMFGIFETDTLGRKGKEKRVLCFASNEVMKEQEDQHSPGRKIVEKDDRFLDICVYRADAKKRIPVVPVPFEEVMRGRTSEGISLVSAGQIPLKHPKRFYKFHLNDPIDTPFVTFRYYYRALEELEALGITGWDEEYDETEEEEEESANTKRSSDVSNCSSLVAARSEASEPSLDAEEVQDPADQSGSSSSETSEENSDSEVRAHGEGDEEETGRKETPHHIQLAPTQGSTPARTPAVHSPSGMETSPSRRRLSIPPAQRLVPTQNTIRIISPIKNLPDPFVDPFMNPPTQEPEPDATEQARKTRHLFSRTPSPRNSEMFENATGVRKRGVSTGLLREVVASAMRKKSTV